MASCSSRENRAKVCDTSAERSAPGRREASGSRALMAERDIASSSCMDQLGGGPERPGTVARLSLSAASSLRMGSEPMERRERACLQQRRAPRRDGRDRPGAWRSLPRPRGWPRRRRSLPSFGVRRAARAACPALRPRTGEPVVLRWPPSRRHGPPGALMADGIEAVARPFGDRPRRAIRRATVRSAAPRQAPHRAYPRRCPPELLGTVVFIVAPADRSLCQNQEVHHPCRTRPAESEMARDAALCNPAHPLSWRVVG